MTEIKKDAPDPLKVYRTQPGNHARDDHVNQRQIDVLFEEVIQQEKLNLDDGSVGIVSPYKNHTAEINRMLGMIGSGSHATLAATVDKFQGRERDTIILNTVDNQISEFVSNSNRLNVAVSRAKNKLIVITSRQDDKRVNKNAIQDLIDYIEYHKYKTVDSEIRSIFDYLYKSYYKRRSLKRISAFDSENLMYELITDVLKNEQFYQFECVAQYPLRMMCNTETFGGRKQQYAENKNTKIDFVIFKKVSKKPILAIEVDGWAYHASKTHDAEIQRERDGLKNEILRDLSIQLIRFSTAGSREREKLITVLRSQTRSGVVTGNNNYVERSIGQTYSEI